MDWTEFVGFLSLPACMAVAFAIRQALSAKSELAAFKTEVAKTYLSIETFNLVERRIMHELEKMDKKLDRMLDQRLEGR